MRKLTSVFSFRLVAAAMILCLITALQIPAVPKVFAASRLGTRFLRLSTSIASINATHLAGLTYTDLTDPLGSIVFEYCINDPLPGTPCTASPGLDLTSATLAAQAGETGFSIHPNTTANRLVLTRTPGIPSIAGSSYQLDNVRNPDGVGTHYVRVQTFSADDGTGTALEEGGLVYAITRAVSISTEVPPFLLFCAGITITGFDCSSINSYFIDMGELQTTQTLSGSSQMVVATNAPSGYSITIFGTTLTSGNNLIDALANPTPSATGVSQFGINLRANGAPPVGAEPTGLGTGVPVNGYGIPNQFKYNSGDVIISSPTTSHYHKFTVSYIANIDAAQEPGIYATTMSFIALGSF